MRNRFRGVEARNDNGEQVQVNQNFQEPALNIARARRALRPYVLALWLFAGLAALAALAVLGQALAAQYAPAARGARAAYRRGLLASPVPCDGGIPRAAHRCRRRAARRRDRARDLTAHADRTTPRDRSRPRPAGRPARRRRRHRADRRAGGARHGPRRAVAAAGTPARGTVADELAGLGVPVPVASGVRFALDRGRDADVPVRSTLVGITVAIAALVATLVYGSALTRFTDSPIRYGWPWAYQVHIDDATATPAEMTHNLATTPGVAGFAHGLYSQFEIGGPQRRRGRRRPGGRGPLSPAPCRTGPGVRRRDGPRCGHDAIAGRPHR